VSFIIGIKQGELFSGVLLKAEEDTGSSNTFFFLLLVPILALAIARKDSSRAFSKRLNSEFMFSIISALQAVCSEGLHKTLCANKITPYINLERIISEISKKLKVCALKRLSSPLVLGVMALHSYQFHSSF